MRHIIFIASMAALVAGMAPRAAARVGLDRVVLDFGPGAPRSQDLVVTNDGDQCEYVAIEPREIVAPGTAAERAVVEPDPARLGLLVTPRKLVLDPGQRRVVRVLTVGPRPARDRIYRVHVRPVVGRVQSDARAAFKVLMAYDVLVMVRPDEAVARPRLARRGRSVVFTNDGNTNALATPAPICDAPGDCVTPRAVRLYPGATQETPLPRGGPAAYTLSWLDHREEIVLPPTPSD